MRTVYELDALGQWTGRTLSLSDMDGRPAGWLETPLLPPTVAFGKADQKDLGGKEFEDVLAGIDHLAAEGLVDPKRVGMGGWSYGGYFSALAATQYSDRFKAAMVGAAITNWVSFTGTTEIEHENSLVH